MKSNYRKNREANALALLNKTTVPVAVIIHKPKLNILQRRVPMWLFFILTGTVAVLFFSNNSLTAEKKIALPIIPVTEVYSNNFNTEIQQQRLKGYHFISPLLFVNFNNESDQLKDLKLSFEAIIEQEKKEFKINSVSVYLKKCGNGEWFSINPNEGFYTASLMKVAILITILKMSESIPGYLDMPYPFRYADPTILKQTYCEKMIIPGNDYKMRELLNYMIIYSDNYASNILNNLMDLTIYTKLFSDLGIKGYDPNDQYTKLNTANVAKLFRLLYNSSYLTKENSEYALSILSQCNFKNGLTKELPFNITVSHKFGEAGGAENQLHDAGIVYAGKDPYFLVIMTRGKQLTNLSQTIGDISKKIYDYMSKRKGALIASPY